MNHSRTPRFFRFTLTLLLCGLTWSGLGRVCFAADLTVIGNLTVSSNLPRIFFDDTATANNNGVPEWSILAYSSLFYINDAQTKTFPFTIEAGAPSYSLSVNSVGNVGLGTFTPAQKLHLVSGGSPILRLEQDGSLGSTPYTWDVGGNEANFFVTDAITGRVPFIVRPGAPTSSIEIAGSGKVGLGTPAPQGNLHIFGAANKDIFNGMGPDLNNGPAFNFGYAGASFGQGTGFFNVRGANSGVNPSLRFATVNQQRLIITNAGRVGIGTLAPTQQLDVSGNIRASGSFIASSTTLNVPDYVFDPDYKLLSLTDLASYVAKEKHLPDIPSAQEIKTQGVNLSALQMQLLKKVEELTLYALEQNQITKAQEHTIATLRRDKREQDKIISELAVRLSALEQAHKQ